MKKVLCILLSIMFTLLLFSPAYASFKLSNEQITDPGFAKLRKYNSYSFDGKDFAVDEVYNDDSGYYSCLRNSLNDSEKFVYDKLVEGLLDGAANLQSLNMFKGHGYDEKEYKAERFSFDLENMEVYGEDFFGMDFYKILYSVTYDRPDFFWLTDGYAWQCKYMDDNDDGLLDYDEKLTSLYLEVPVFYAYYENDDFRGNGIIGKYNNIFNIIKSFDFSACNNRYEFLKKLHDYLISYIDYDQTYFNCYDLSGALLDRKAVCMGYSFAVKAICNYYKIPCAVCTSTEVPASETNKHIEAHMWNAVLMDDGKWYYIDTTWDDHPEYTKEKIIYDYFLCGSKSTASHFNNKFYSNHIEQSADEAYIPNVPKCETAYVYNKNANTRFTINSNAKESQDEYNVLLLNVPYLKDYIYFNGLAYNITSSEDGRSVTVSDNGTNEKWKLIFTGDCDHTETKLRETPASCIAKGKIEKVCVVCGDVIETVKILEKTGHTSDGGTVTVKPTCTSEGKKTYKCSVCKAVIKTEKIAKTAHNYNKLVVKRATLTENGLSTPTCSGCGATKTATVIYRPKTFKLSTTSYICDGKAKKPTVKVTDANGKTISSSNYTVTYKNNTAAGTATATVEFKNNYYGTKTLKFTIALNKVSGLKASTVKTTSIGLTWTKVAGAKYYKIEQSTDGKIWKTIKTADKNSYTVSKLAAGKKYQFRVTALDSTKKQKGAVSSVLKTGTLTSAPKLTIKSSKSKTATVTWKKVTGASKYVIYKSTDGKKWTKVTTVTGTSCTLTKLTGGKKIYAKALAVNAYGNNSAYSGAVNVKVKK